MLRINNEISSEISQDMEELFKALANVNRIILIHSLASGEVDRISVTQMAKIMGLTQPAASQHLKILKNAKILYPQKEGNYIYYTFDENALLEHKRKIDFLFRCALAKCEQQKSK